MQRVLAHDQPIVVDPADPIVAVTELKQGAVYRLDAQGGSQLIVKVEAFRPGEGEAGFGGRHRATTELAARVIQVPGVEPLGAGEIAVLKGLPDMGPGLASLKQAIAQKEAGDLRMFFRAERVDAGSALGEVFNPHDGAPDAGQVAAKRAQLLDPQVYATLGRIAALDLLVGNGDRFRADGSVNLDNLDFNQAGPVSIDNVDPWSRSLEPGQEWEGERWLTSVDGMTAYARSAVEDLFGATEPGRAMMVSFFIGPFLQGMQAAADTLRQGLAGRRLQLVHEPPSPYADAMAAFLGRIERMPG